MNARRRTLSFFLFVSLVGLPPISGSDNLTLSDLFFRLCVALFCWKKGVCMAPWSQCSKTVSPPLMTVIRWNRRAIFIWILMSSACLIFAAAPKASPTPWLLIHTHTHSLSLSLLGLFISIIQSLSPHFAPDVLAFHSSPSLCSKTEPEEGILRPSYHSPRYPPPLSWSDQLFILHPILFYSLSFHLSVRTCMLGGSQPCTEPLCIFWWSHLCMTQLLVSCWLSGRHQCPKRVLFANALLK